MFLLLTKCEIVSFLVLKKSSRCKSRTAGYRRGTFMLEGRKKKSPSISVCCHYFWRAVFGGMLHVAAQVSSMERLLLVRVELQNSRWFQCDRKVLLAVPEPQLETLRSSFSSAPTPTSRYKVLSSYTLLFHTPFLVEFSSLNMFLLNAGDGCCITHMVQNGSC